MSAPDEDVGYEATAVRDPLIGATVQGYRILRAIGVGGMGKVYEAEEPNIGRRAAVKVLLPEVAQQPELVARLKAEARAANAARHRGIIDVFGFAELPDGRQAIIMEHLDGVPLDDELLRLAREGRRMPVLEAIDVLDQVSAALHAAHLAGVTHRDLKPSNIFLCKSTEASRTVKVLDFGVAKVDGMQNSPRTATNIIMGTPSYMAPEQSAGEPAAASMDLYALGVIAFELFTGQLPFAHEGVMALLLAHQQTPPPVPSSIAPSLPVVIDEFVLRLLEKRPADRFASGAEVRAALQQLRKVVGDAEAITTQPALHVEDQETRRILVTPPRAARGGGRAEGSRRWGFALAGGVLLVAVLGALVLRRPVEVPRPPPLEVPLPSPAPVAVAPAAAAPAPPAPAPVEPAVVEVALQAGVAPAPETTTAAPQAAKAGTQQPAAAPRAGDARWRLLARRVAALDARLTAAAQRGENVTLERRQVTALRRALGGSAGARTLDEVETALQRLEGDSR